MVKALQNSAPWLGFVSVGKEIAMQFLDPKNDVAFKKIFGSEEHKRVTISFLNSMLEYREDKAIVAIDFLNTEQHPLVVREKKDNILDILCTDQRGDRYIVEMQVDKIKEFGKRMVYYGAKTYALQLGKGKPYDSLAPVIVIALLNFTMFPHKKAYKSTHQLPDNKTYECDLEELKFVFVELKKFPKNEHELVTDEEKWIYFIKEISRQTAIPEALAQGEFKEACHAAERMTWSEEHLNAYEDAFVRETDVKGQLELAREEGEKKKALEIAKNLLAAGVDARLIAQTTQLLPEEIEQLVRK